MAAVIVQDSFRYYADGTEAGATALYAVNTDGELNVHTTYGMRYLVKNTGTVALNNIDFEWQYNLNGAGWNNITTTSSVVKAVNSNNLTNGADCTQRIGVGTFHVNNDGVTEDGTSGGANLDLVNGTETETLLVFQIVGADVVDGDAIQMRLTRDVGTLLDTYTTTLSLTVNIPGPIIKQTATASGTTTNTVTTGNLDGGTNQLYAVWVGMNGTLQTVQSVTGGGLTWTQARHQCAGRNTIAVAVWTAYGSPASPFGVVVTLTGTIDSIAAIAARMTGVNFATPTEDVVGQNTVAENDTGCSGGTDSTTPSLTTGTTNANSIHIAGLGRRVSTVTSDGDYFTHTTATAGSGGTTINLTLDSRHKGATGDDTFNPTLSATNDWATVGFVAVVAGTTTPQAVAGAVAWTGGPVMRTAKVLSGAQTWTGVLANQTGKILSGALTSAGVLVNQALKSLSGETGLAGVVATAKTTAQAVSGAISFAGTLVNQTAKALAGAISLSGVVATAKTTVQAVSGAISFASTLVNRAGKALAGAASFSGTITQVTNKALSGSLTYVGTLTQRTGKALSGALTYTGTLVNRAGKALAGAITPTGDLARSIGKLVSGALTSAGALATQFIASGNTLFLQAVAGTLTYTGTVANQTIKALSGVLTYSGALVQLTSKTLTGELTIAGTVAKRIGRLLSGALTLAGDVIRTFGGPPGDATLTVTRVGDMIMAELVGTAALSVTLVGMVLDVLPVGTASLQATRVGSMVDEVL